MKQKEHRPKKDLYAEINQSDILQNSDISSSFLLRHPSYPENNLYTPSLFSSHPSFPVQMKEGTPSNSFLNSLIPNIPDALQKKMEKSFGTNFSDISIHDNSPKAKTLGARAFTQGKHIHFASGEFQPNTKSGQELIGHELTHVVQQKRGKARGDNVQGENIVNQDVVLEQEANQAGEKVANGDYVFVNGKASGIQMQTAPAVPSKEKLDEIVTRYNKMVAQAKLLGFDVAADNLDHFLNGNGKTKVLSSSWLRGYGEITDAEEVNQKRFEKELIKKADAMKDGEKKVVSDYWDRGVYAKGLNELFYASGGSTITSKGTFTLAREGNKVTIIGSVNHHWHDPYDWHAGLTAFVPGYGNVSDADALLLEQYRGAHSFEMESDWQQELLASVDTNRWTDYWGTSFNWKLK